jgi:hypothetical protein
MLSEGSVVLLSRHDTSPATRPESFGLGRTFTDRLICPYLDTAKHQSGWSNGSVLRPSGIGWRDDITECIIIDPGGSRLRCGPLSHVSRRKIPILGSGTDVANKKRNMLGLHVWFSERAKFQ